VIISALEGWPDAVPLVASIVLSLNNTNLILHGSRIERFFGKLFCHFRSDKYICSIWLPCKLIQITLRKHDKIWVKTEHCFNNRSCYHKKELKAGRHVIWLTLYGVYILHLIHYAQLCMLYSDILYNVTIVWVLYY
jgi:hypothetical protein